jgi:hypothetical protein
VAMEIMKSGTGFYPGNGYVYASFVIVTMMGYLLRNRIKPLNVVLYSLASSVIFFALSNFGSWMTMDMYTKDMTGFINCYTQALPFFKYTFIGDTLFSVVLFGGFYLLTRTQQQTQQA